MDKFVMLTSMAGPAGVVNVDDVVALESDEAKRLLDKGFCRPVRKGSDPELAVDRKQRELAVTNAKHHREYADACAARMPELEERFTAAKKALSDARKAAKGSEDPDNDPDVVAATRALEQVSAVGEEAGKIASEAADKADASEQAAAEMTKAAQKCVPEEAVPAAA